MVQWQWCRSLTTYSLASSDMPSGSSKSWLTIGDAARMRPKTAPHVVDSSIHTADSCNGPATRQHKIVLFHI